MNRFLSDGCCFCEELQLSFSQPAIKKEEEEEEEEEEVVVVVVHAAALWRKQQTKKQQTTNLYYTKSVKYGNQKQNKGS